MDKNIPLQDLVKQNASIREQLINTFTEVIDSGRYVSGPGVENFENEFANYVGAKFGVGLSSGSSAVELALKANGIESGDEVIVPAVSWSTTYYPINQAGLVIKFVDVNLAL
jgi:CDP-6-deoxy-D-xylo-4-hexulose-3-dehydrase